MRDSQFANFMNSVKGGSFDYKKDFLNVAKNKKVVEDMKKGKEPAISAACLSDAIHLFNSKLAKCRSCIVVTRGKIFLYDMSSWRRLSAHAIRTLQGISISLANPAVFCFHFEQGHNVIVESYRRIDIVVYCAQLMKELKLPLFQLKFKRSIEPRKSTKGKTDPIYKEEKSKSKSKSLNEDQLLLDTVRNSKKTGFLKLLTKGLFGSHSREYFLLLSNIGLVFFTRYGQRRSHGFIPILGATVQALAKAATGRDCCFGVLLEGEQWVFEGHSRMEAEEWVQAIKGVQAAAVYSKDTLRQLNTVI